MAIAALLPACAQLVRNTAQEDAELVRAIVRVNLDEIAAGKLAASKAGSRALRQYGARMAREHRQLQAEASDLSPAARVGLPAGYDFAALRKLDRLSGAAFDAAYKALTLERHENLARLLERAMSRAADPGLRTFSERALPAVRKHLKEANGIGL